MRSSKSRSRSKSNRPRSPLGNIINRVFDSSGPEGKVRGTPQQIIDKYLALARDAQLSNDRVAAENFLQHAEHYARLLGEAQREIEAQRREFGGGPAPAPNGYGGEPAREDRGGERRDERREDRGGERRDERRPPTPAPAAVAVIDFADEEGPALVETPEMRAAPSPAPAPVPAEDIAPLGLDAAAAPQAVEAKAAAPRVPARSRRRPAPRPAAAAGPSEAAE